MNVGSEVTVGTIAIVKVGRNEVEVTVTGITEHGWMVKSRSTGSEFEVTHLERIVNDQVPGEILNPAQRCGNPAKKLSLLNAAIQILAASRIPMNTKELVVKAIEMNLWVPTGAKTPEQTLYSAIFREIKTCETPRIIRAEKKASFKSPDFTLGRSTFAEYYCKCRSTFAVLACIFQPSYNISLRNMGELSESEPAIAIFAVDKFRIT